MPGVVRWESFCAWPAASEWPVAAAIAVRVEVAVVLAVALVVMLVAVVVVFIVFVLVVAGDGVLDALVVESCLQNPSKWSLDPAFAPLGHALSGRLFTKPTWKPLISLENRGVLGPRHPPSHDSLRPRSIHCRTPQQSATICCECLGS